MRLLDPRRSRLVLATAVLALLAAPAGAAVTTYTATLSGAAEAPPNASPGIGTTTVEVDPVAHTMRVQANFTGLIGNTTNCHIHAPTAVAGTGTASVATTLPTFPGFPSGVTAGSYDNTFNMTLASSYSSGYLTANGGNTAAAELALYQAMADGKAYLNVHSTTFGGGEIRGFLQVSNPTPARHSSWGRIKALFR